MNTTEFLGRRLTADRLRFYSISVIAICVILTAVSLLTSRDGRTIFGTRLGGDFPAFFVAGRLVNDHGSNAAYDTELHFRVYHDLFPKEPAAESLPYVNPPFLLPLFSVLAYLPYRLALSVWLLISALLYIAAIRISVRDSEHLSHEFQTTAILLAASFAPFITYAWAWGQLSALAVFFVALAIHFEKQGEQFLSGFVLSACAYKPVLLIVFVPMILITKRWRAVCGLIIGGAVLGTVSLVMLGWNGMLTYLRLLETFRQAKAGSIFRTWVYVDLRSFLHPFGDPWPVAIIQCALIAIGVCALVYAWLTVKDRGLVWAVTIILSLLLNVYTPIYDCSLLALAALLVADRYYESGFPSFQFRVILTVLWLLPWVSQALAHKLGIQLYTIAIAAFAAHAITSSSAQPKGRYQHLLNLR